MARTITSTTPAGFAGSDLDRDAVAVIGAIRDAGLDAGAVDAVRGDYIAARDAAIMARDVDAAIAIIAVVDALSDSNAVAFDADRRAAAVAMAFEIVAAHHIASLSPRAAAMVARDAATIVAPHAPTLGRIGAVDESAYAPSADRGSFGAVGTAKRGVGVAVDAALTAHGDATLTQTEIANWATANNVAGYSNALPLSGGAVGAYLKSLSATGPRATNAAHGRAHGIVADWQERGALSARRTIAGE